MPMIYKRFTEKSAEEWRQIYKALQLIEFLIKNGSERVIDDVRSHMSLLKMLRQFRYTDLNGKDQGINVRHRSKELVDLLSDVEKIRAERKKARADNGKSGRMGGMAGGTSSNYGGFGNNAGEASYGNYSGGVYGDGGGFGGNTEQDDYGAATQNRQDDYDEYNEFDEGAVASGSAKRRTEPSRAKPTSPTKTRPARAEPQPPEEDLFDFGEGDLVQPAPTQTAPGPSLLTTGANDDDDDFDDFQSATAAPQTQAGHLLGTMAPPSSASTMSATSTSTFANRPGQSNGGTSAFGNILPPTMSSTSSPASSNTLPRSTASVASGPNYFTSVPVQSAASTTGTNLASPLNTLASPASSTSTLNSAKPKPAGDAFANLLGAVSMKNKSTSNQRLTMQEMAKQKSSAGLWGASSPAAASGASAANGRDPAAASAGTVKTTGAPSSAMDDLLG